VAQTHFVSYIGAFHRSVILDIVSNGAVAYSKLIDQNIVIESSIGVNMVEHHQRVSDKRSDRQLLLSGKQQNVVAGDLRELVVSQQGMLLASIRVVEVRLAMRIRAVRQDLVVVVGFQGEVDSALRRWALQRSGVEDLLHRALDMVLLDNMDQAGNEKPSNRERIGRYPHIL
jgi:hypothetical protein